MDSAIIQALTRLFDLGVFAHLSSTAQNDALLLLNTHYIRAEVSIKQRLALSVQSVAYYGDRFCKIPFVPSTETEVGDFIQGQPYRASRNWNDKYLLDYTRRFQQGTDLYPMLTRRTSDAQILGWAWLLECPVRNPGTGLVDLRIQPIRMPPTRLPTIATAS